MDKSEETVKIINHGSGNRTPITTALGIAVGVATGAGATKAFFQRRKARSGGRDPQQPSKPQRKRNSAVSPFDPEMVGIDEPKEQKGLKAKLLHLGERKGWGWLGRTLQVQRRYAEIQGNNVASAVTLQVFVALFPLFLVAAAIVGFVIQGSDTDVIGRIINSMGLKGGAADSMRKTLETATESRKASSVLGLLTLFWSALGVSSALQYAYNQAWQSGGRGIKDKLVGVGWLGGAAILFVATAAATTVIGWLPAQLSILGIVLGIAISFALWLFTAKVLPNVNVSWRELIPGTILGVIGLEILKVLGGVWVPKAVESSSSVYGTVGVVFAILAWMLIFGKLVVYSAVLNVVMYEGKYGVDTATIEIPKPAASSQGITRAGQSDTA